MGARSEMIEVRPGLALHVLRYGDAGGDDGAGPVPFLLVHGLASNARLWDGVGARLAAAGHPAAAVDQRGHGLSAKPDDGYDFATLVGDLVGLIEALGFDRPVVAGQSWGGNVVLELAARRPELVRGVVCVDGGMIELGRAFPEWDDCAARLAPPELVGRPYAEVERWTRKAHADWPEEGIQGALACYERCDDGTIRPHLSRDRHMTILRHLWEHRPSALFGGVEVPVLLVPCRGEDGPPAKEETVAEAERALRNVRTEWMTADHDVHAQHPDRVAALLLRCVEDGFFS